LSQLQDRLPPFPFDDVRTTIEDEFGRPLAELFRSFDEEPVAAASIA
jgi:ubiquinone biosynthesis protein